MATVSNKIALQMSRISVFSSSAAAAEAGLIDNWSLRAANAKLDAITQQWNRFIEDHEKLLSSKTDVTVEHKYFTDGSFENALKLFESAQDALLHRINDIESSLPSHGSTLADSSLILPTGSRLNVPTIPVPKFSGKYQDWKHFHDMFVSLIGENTSLTAVEKMYHLKTSLEGDAARLIANIKVTGDSFASAWDAVVQQYDNKRLLISAQLDKLFSIRPADNNSSQQLKAILNTANESVQALNALGSPTAHWDQILVHLIVQKLDISLREAWEVNLGTSTEFPSYDELRTFLSGRVRAREAMECGVSPRKSQSESRTSRFPKNKIIPAHVHLSAPVQTSQNTAQHKVTRQHQVQHPHTSQSQSHQNQGNQSHPPTPKHTLSFKSDYCQCCEGSHFIVGCPKFQSMSPDERFQLAVQYQLCLNCLGDHHFSNCRSKRRCKECNGEHHSMIHFSKLIKATNKPAKQNEAPSEEVSPPSSRTPPSQQ